MDTFLSVLQHGHLLSKRYQEEFAKRTTTPILSELRSHHELTRALGRAQLRFETIEKYCKAVITGDRSRAEREEAKLRATGVQSFTIKSINSAIELVSGAVKNHRFTGIGYHKDKQAGTDKHVFCIVGPHTDKAYGDILFVLKRDIMHHPDFYVTPCAVTVFLSNRVQTLMPWLVEPGKTAQETLERCKINPYAKDWALAMAAQWQLCAKSTRMPPLEYWNKTNSHMVFEGHLPSKVPLSFVEKVFMPRNLWDLVPADEKEMFERSIGKSLLHLSDSPEEVFADSIDASTQKSTRQLKGFEMSLHPLKRSHVVLPIFVSTSMAIHVRALGGPWAIGVGKHNDNNQEIHEGVWFIVDWDAERTIQNRRAVAKHKSNKLQQLTSFNATASFTEFQAYTLEISISGPKVQFSFWNDKSPHHPLRCEQPSSVFGFVKSLLKTDATRLRVGLSTDTRAVAFKDVFVEKIRK
eukprot:c19612_g1_i2.p1 GENE.c19612_g1_i2~~c19612_g1_i2.p1  ORF type:complete len:516 (+),score=112.83 c19612_g1_i2:153-1550(+)